LKREAGGEGLKNTEGPPRTWENERGASRKKAQKKGLSLMESIGVYTDRLKNRKDRCSICGWGEGPLKQSEIGIFGTIGELTGNRLPTVKRVSYVGRRNSEPPSLIFWAGQVKGPRSNSCSSQTEALRF